MAIRIIVHNGKHATDCYDASTPEAWAASCVELLRRMDYDGRGAYQIWPEGLAEPEYVEAELLPEPYRTQALKDNDYKKLRYEEARDNNERVTEIHRIITENDRSLFVYGAGTKRERSVPIAWEILDQRSDYEYEGVRLETVWSEEPAVVSS
jgi:hypothetical protein